VFARLAIKYFLLMVLMLFGEKYDDSLKGFVLSGLVQAFDRFLLLHSLSFSFCFWFACLHDRMV